MSRVLCQSSPGTDLPSSAVKLIPFIDAWVLVLSEVSYTAGYVGDYPVNGTRSKCSVSFIEATHHHQAYGLSCCHHGWSNSTRTIIIKPFRTTINVSTFWCWILKPLTSCSNVGDWLCRKGGKFLRYYLPNRGRKQPQVLWSAGKTRYKNNRL